MNKNIYLVFSLLILIALQSCNNSTEPSNSEPADLFQIHLQSWFSNTPVRVTVDTLLVFNDTISTGLTIAVAAIIPLQINKGMHTLSTTADSITKDTTFVINDTLYVGVIYEATLSQIRYRFQHNPFLYR